jgi:peroxiredoxin 2/4
MNFMAEFTMPRIGEAAPDFSASSTNGELRLSAWADKQWVILLGYPAAFTPVAVTEFKEIVGKNEKLRERNTKILAVSPDTVYSLLAWKRDLRERFQINADFPLISDSKLKIAKSYGMIHPGATSHAPVRATYILDPKRTVRYCSFYPLANGRSIAEILRVVQAIQVSDDQQTLTPAEWRPGKDVLKAAPGSYDKVDLGSQKEGEDFYLKFQKEHA